MKIQLRDIFEPLSANHMAKVDLWFVMSLIAILALGIVMVASASISVSESIHNTPYFFMGRQILYLILGVSFGFMMLQIPTQNLQKWGILLMLLSLVLLVLVLVPGIGKTVNGSRRWINLIVFNLQASEVAKVCMVVYVSGYLVRRAERVRENLIGFALPLFLTSLFLIFLLMEPDFGASVVLIGTVIALLFIGGAPVYQFIAIVIMAVLVMAGLALSESYRVKRLMNFVDPWADPFNDGYQLSQALIAYGRGEWFGLGLGNSVQKLSYLPEAHTDFVFSIWVEEMGLLGGVVLLSLFALMLSRIFKIGHRALMGARPFAGYMCFGFAILILAQVIINVGVNTGFLPTKGLTLPLISYGGSSLIITLGSLFVVARVDIENKLASKGGESEERKRKSDESIDDGEALA
ncbi:putative lipid II flippase FtsW [Marinomonas mediterranea]|jgi:cell division-specific peptidoglycan biosynthesis regulator FtsW|uniref:Probable peptidoglycan glycosyltransferase FtsW n=2 Tax=Marinomonas mediterranea TaxID=119864 RepID=FTSW_MARM1|nr:putative lipid II flippase FtsW [Marinomonas mediterranea]F2JVW9.1 RecName: Full=Probable peptidoglycan glycosyltransferase FtsW; Short=PGT; AltName: Full=Cell division protein FtsW; AltName: Full=Cell wall polymerase; AltName: Full=Peptidoglycan polymerase; Short=PG polymerase [Marinomonas mediterranea MMB-1]ADZ91755.1 cell division protein FtsW [Marinomonas mediterranea MMB-1]WCN13793.1 putative lipid II flippase FtsW [Marinomonas mediterranea]WCN17849.1 putative lipid II flippase FtsW [Ma